MHKCATLGFLRDLKKFLVALHILSRFNSGSHQSSAYIRETHETMEDRLSPALNLNEIGKNFVR
jgi:hypothetical protein